MARWTLVILALGTAPGALAAQTTPVAPSQTAQTPQAPAQTPDPVGTGAAGTDAEGEVEEIVVTGRPLPGAVPGDIKPELQLTPADIRSYGSNSITDLLSELAPQTQSVRGGEPVILINGRRSAGFREIADFPPEALLRVDILPEEVALKFGYRADQKVINFVLRPRFRSYTGEPEGSAPTDGGSSNFEAEGGLVRIDRDKRFNLNLQAETTSNLLESERGIALNPTGTPFDLTGNVTSTISGAAIDPALGNATIAGVPAGTPTLAGFAAGGGNPNVTDTTPFRTLQAQSDRFSANAVYSRNVFGTVAATVNGRIEHNRSQSLLGLPALTLTLPGASPFSPFDNDVRVLRYADADPLRRDSETTTANLGVVLNGDIGRWRWTANGSYDRIESETRTERGVDAAALQAGVLAGTASPFGDLGSFLRTADRARSVSSAGAIEGLASGSPFSLPAGEANASVRLAGRTTDFSSRSQRSGIDSSAEIGRDSGSVRANIDLPIANAQRGVLSFLGRLSLNGNVELEQLSDFGTLTTYGYGVNWQPVTPVRIIANFTTEENAPSQQQLGNPTVVTPFVRVFDYVSGQSVDVTTVTGGNAALVAETNKSFKLGLNVKPWSARNLTFQADYLSERTDNPIQGFPAITSEIQNAFPDRFVRDADGTLIRLDTRSVNFARAENNQLRYGLNFFQRITTARSRAADAQRQARMEARRAARDAAEAGRPTSDTPPPPPGDGPREGRGFGGPDGPGGGGRRGFGGPGFGGPGGGGGGGFRVSLYHTVVFTDRILIRPGLPELDLLNGSATGDSGGTSRHQVQLRGGYTRDGYGANFGIDWREGTQVNGGTAGTQSLDFSSLARVNMRLFINPGEQPSWVRGNRWLRGSRISLSVDNLFNARQRVTGADGEVPFRFQPGFIDPLGRVVRVTFRKLFF
ncbi:TonB-dependent receptor [Sphingomonas sp. 2R-10]|uniref:TonB-dependent receptor n=1 Tax=Sphingomonas sp. 2R-10 TaxID=3045148 RepID=UPI000F7ACD82|nr:TonB-dependent receptor [Sphingomonas sp. 2R-10]MDJ0276539.1 TonB-dependent receptor [Sphingomonas sp. 2R-10]